MLVEQVPGEMVVAWDNGGAPMAGSASITSATNSTTWRFPFGVSSS